MPGALERVRYTCAHASLNVVFSDVCHVLAVEVLIMSLVNLRIAPR